jgi:uncharacterized protein (DUF2062 family)
VNEIRYIHIFGDTLKQAELWAFNRSTVTSGIAIGVFCAFLPMPFEMFAALLIAAMIGANVPCALTFVWISNPLTWIPLYTPCYLLGASILRIDPIPLSQISILQVGWHYVALWLGCLIVGTAISLTTHFILNMIWRAQIRRRWQKRRHLRLTRKRKA